MSDVTLDYTRALPLHAATDVNPMVPVAIGGWSSTPGYSGFRPVIPIATVNVEPIGVTQATHLAGKAAAIYGAGQLAKGVAQATVAVGDNVGYATTTGIGPVTAASGVVKYRVGQAVERANPGQSFTFLVNPKQLSGAA